MAEEPTSQLDALIGRRFPLMVVLLLSALLFYYLGGAEIAATLIGGAILLVKGYVDDIADEKA